MQYYNLKKTIGRYYSLNKSVNDFLVVNGEFYKNISFDPAGFKVWINSDTEPCMYT